MVLSKNLSPSSRPMKLFLSYQFHSFRKHPTETCKKSFRSFLVMSTHCFQPVYNHRYLYITLSMDAVHTYRRVIHYGWDKSRLRHVMRIELSPDLFLFCSLSFQFSWFDNLLSSSLRRRHSSLFRGCGTREQWRKSLVTNKARFSQRLTCLTVFMYMRHSVGHDSSVHIGQRFFSFIGWLTYVKWWKA